MAWDFKFDPVAGDLIDDGAGSFERTETAETLVRNQLLAHAGECWHDVLLPTEEPLGSRLHDLDYLQEDPKTNAEDEARRSLGVVEATGRIIGLEVAGEERVGAVAVATKFRDASSGQLVDTFVKAGG